MKTILTLLLAVAVLTGCATTELKAPCSPATALSVSETPCERSPINGANALQF